MDSPIPLKCIPLPSTCYLKDHPSTWVHKSCVRCIGYISLPGSAKWKTMLRWVFLQFFTVQKTDPCPKTLKQIYVSSTLKHHDLYLRRPDVAFFAYARVGIENSPRIDSCHDEPRSSVVTPTEACVIADTIVPLLLSPQLLVGGLGLAKESS